ncbi:Microtubule-associated protein 4 [Cricetulus griseus]|uniref:Microtubule-associated protein n=1 Tax=Cricetulus griseus TaxID=10029 RepID=G3HKQ7_CRIGR|nr:Microtubule-associated protein 4 [Cricetulus griseus]
MADLSLVDALTDPPPEIEGEIKRDFIATLEAEPYDDTVGETVEKTEYIPLMDGDEKIGNPESKKKPCSDTSQADGSPTDFLEEKMAYQEYQNSQNWPEDASFCFQPQQVLGTNQAELSKEIEVKSVKEQLPTKELEMMAEEKTTDVVPCRETDVSLSTDMTPGTETEVALAKDAEEATKPDVILSDALQPSIESDISLAEDMELCVGTEVTPVKDIILPTEADVSLTEGMAPPTEDEMVPDKDVTLPKETEMTLPIAMDLVPPEDMALVKETELAPVKGMVSLSEIEVSLAKDAESSTAEEMALPSDTPMVLTKDATLPLETEGSLVKGMTPSLETEMTLAKEIAPPIETKIDMVRDMASLPESEVSLGKEVVTLLEKQVVTEFNSSTPLSEKEVASVKDISLPPETEAPLGKDAVLPSETELTLDNNVTPAKDITLPSELEVAAVQIENKENEQAQEEFGEDSQLQSVQHKGQSAIPPCMILPVPQRDDSREARDIESMPVMMRKKKKKPKQKRYPQSRTGGPWNDNTDEPKDHSVAPGPLKSGVGPSHPTTVGTQYGLVSREILKCDCAESHSITSCTEQPPETVVNAQLKLRVEEDHRGNSSVPKNQDENLLQQEELRSPATPHLDTSRTVGSSNLEGSLIGSAAHKVTTLLGGCSPILGQEIMNSISKPTTEKVLSNLTLTSTADNPFEDCLKEGNGESKMTKLQVFPDRVKDVKELKPETSPKQGEGTSLCVSKELRDQELIQDPGLEREPFKRMMGDSKNRKGRGPGKVRTGSGKAGAKSEVSFLLNSEKDGRAVPVSRKPVPELEIVNIEASRRGLGLDSSKQPEAITDLTEAVVRVAKDMADAGVGGTTSPLIPLETGSSLALASEARTEKRGIARQEEGKAAVSVTGNDITTPPNKELPPSPEKKGKPITDAKIPEKRTSPSKPVSALRPGPKTIPTVSKATSPSTLVSTGPISRSPATPLPKRPISTKTEGKAADVKRMTAKSAPADLNRSKTTSASSVKRNTTPTGAAPPVGMTAPRVKPMSAPSRPSVALSVDKKPISAKPSSSAPRLSRLTPTASGPSLKSVRSKIGSTENIKHQPGGGRAKVEKKTEAAATAGKPEPNAVTKAAGSIGSAQRPPVGKVQIQNKKVDISKVSSKCGSKANIKHKPGGGDVKIESQKLNFKEKAQAKVGSLDNVGHLPAGGAVKVTEGGGSEAPPCPGLPAGEELAIPEAEPDAGAPTSASGLSGHTTLSGGGDQREPQTLDSQIQETTCSGSSNPAAFTFFHPLVGPAPTYYPTTAPLLYGESWEEG